jgi:tetratricopeptide (TPR) repeat protein
MQKLGRNDPCHCGSGNKYKKCCLSKDEAANITRVTANSSPLTEAEIYESVIDRELQWDNPLYLITAHMLVKNMAAEYPQHEVITAIRLWNDFADHEMPVIKKAGVFPAAIEYCFSLIYGYETTQSSLSEKYNVSVAVISQRSNQIMDYLDEHMPPVPDQEFAPQVSLGGQAMERELQQITALLEEQKFDSVEEANAFLKQLNLNQSQTGSMKNSSNKDQAQDLIYDAWDEPNFKKRIQMAKDALILFPDTADAYNILAENAAATVKESAYYYKQGILAGERELGEAFFKKNKGFFWGHLETRPYMRAKMGYAEACASMENTSEAIKHYMELLELNPNDNQGVRDLLLLAYLETGDWKNGSALINKYKNDNSASFNYNRMLIEYGLHGLSVKLKSLLKDAKKQNPYVPSYLLAKKRIPRQTPEYMGFGDDREAVVYAQTHHHLWQSKPELLRWMGQNI